MFTDPLPRKKTRRKLFLDSDSLAALPLPPDGKLTELATQIEAAMKAGRPKDVHASSGEFLRAACDFYRVPQCGVRVLAARPLRVREYSTSELFGDYHPDGKAIRIWMRTAVRKEVTSFGTFLSTLCHEFCHHLDLEKFAFGDSWHTRGFYSRAAALYHHAKGTPVKQLLWMPMPRGRWRRDWQRTNRALSPERAGRTE
ncbi:MAG: hypothetical protein KGL02_13570 [Acidobacteriota bacterium]|nr:hypothetical protein [Acidobacteriota bacterium]